MIYCIYFNISAPPCEYNRIFRPFPHKTAPTPQERAIACGRSDTSFVSMVDLVVSAFSQEGPKLRIGRLCLEAIYLLEVVFAHEGFYCIDGCVDSIAAEERRNGTSQVASQLPQR